MVHKITKIALTLFASSFLFGCNVSGVTENVQQNQEQTPSTAMADSQTVSSESIGSKPPNASVNVDDEVEQFLEFWSEANIEDFICEPMDESGEMEQYKDHYWIIVSEYMQNHDKAAGIEIHYDSNGIAYYPISSFEGTTKDMFGYTIDYTRGPAQDAGPEDGTLCVANGYGRGMMEGTIDTDSITISGTSISCMVNFLWIEDQRDMGSLTYTFEIEPQNKFCRYRLAAVVQ